MKNFSSVFGNNVIEWKFSFAKGVCFKNQRNAGPLFFIYIYFSPHDTLKISHGKNEFFILL